ncbi:16217_t:CDS:2, partial [Cetraspora pellucida]
INFGADLNVILGMPPMSNMKSDTEKVENLIEMLKNIVEKNATRSPAVEQLFK